MEETVTLSLGGVNNYAEPIFYCRDNGIPYTADPVDLESSSYDYETVHLANGLSYQVVNQIIRPLSITVPVSAASLLMLKYEHMFVIDVEQQWKDFNETIIKSRR